MLLRPLHSSVQAPSCLHAGVMAMPLRASSLTSLRHAGAIGRLCGAVDHGFAACLPSVL